MSDLIKLDPWSSVLGFTDFDILDFGNSIMLAGAIFTQEGREGKEGHVYLVPFPGEKAEGKVHTVWLSDAEYERVLNQTDVLDVRAPNKAILRKSQRIIDSHMSWEVFRRDGFVCRYCGGEKPLTVDHVICWESGGASIRDNLISACKRCNKLRGNMPYDDWMKSVEYAGVARGLSPDAHLRNIAVVGKLEELRRVVAKPRSR